MKNCNKTKTHIDNFRHIDKQQRQAVHGHIATCEECAEYKVMADSTADLLGSLCKEIKQISVNDQFYKKTQARAKKERSSTMIALSGCVVSLFALVWLYSKGNLTLEGAMVIGAWAVCSGLYGWWSSRKALRFNSVSTSEGFLLGWAKDLSRQIKVTTTATVIVSIEIILVMLGLSVHGFSAQGAIILLGVNAILLIGVIYAVVIELPGLKSELALIKDDS